jgi:hypothetical protein
MKPPTLRQGVSGPEATRSTDSAGLRELAWYFLRLGALGFGGPIALVGYMQKDLVEDRRWFSQEDYLQGLDGPFASMATVPSAISKSRTDQCGHTRLFQNDKLGHITVLR